jgi:hypothetical protein
MTRYAAHAPGNFALPLVNGQPIDLHAEAVYESPFLNGSHGGDRFRISVGPVERILDFQAMPERQKAVYLRASSVRTAREERIRSSAVTSVRPWILAVATSIRSAGSLWNRPGSL